MGLRIHAQAFADLLKRYGAVWKLAWARREEMEPVERLPHEAQFLPAALSLQETPVSPAPRVIMWLLIAFAGVAVSWAALGELDVVATAQGKIVANDRTKTIQPIDTASIKAIHVTDGQAVKAGDVLIELDPTNTKADLARLERELMAARLQVARGDAMLAVLEGKSTTKLASISGANANDLAEARLLLTSQRAEYLAKRAGVDAELGKRAAELVSTKDLVAKLERTLPLASQRAQNYKNLVEKNYVSRHGYLDREQIRIEQESDLAHEKSRAKEIEAAMTEARVQKVTLAAETRRVQLDSVTEGNQKIAALEQDVLKARSKNALTNITSPVDGTVQQLAVHTIGGVVTPAQPLMLIVPHDAAFEVEAFLENKDVGFVHPKQKAEVKVETFQYTKYGTIHAEVTSVSSDAINDEKRGLIYAMRVTMAKSNINVDGLEVNLAPGMAVTVEVKTGKRRLIEYFLSPLLRHSQESLRER